MFCCNLKLPLDLLSTFSNWKDIFYDLASDHVELKVILYSTPKKIMFISKETMN